MRVDPQMGLKRNLGFDPIREAPRRLPTFCLQAGSGSGNLRRLPSRRRSSIFDFPKSPAGLQFLAFTTGRTGLSRIIPMSLGRGGLAPRTGPKPPARAAAARCPGADCAPWSPGPWMSGHAASAALLTPGKDSRNDYLSYTHNFALDFQEDAPRLPRLSRRSVSGAYWTTGPSAGKSVVVLSSRDSHMSQGRSAACPTSISGARSSRKCGPTLRDHHGARPAAIGQAVRGSADVVVSPRRSAFDWHLEIQEGSPSRRRTTRAHPAKANAIFATAARGLFQGERPAAFPRTNTPSAQDHPGGAYCLGLLRGSTTDFLRLRYPSDDHYKLKRALGDVSEMGDAVSWAGRPREMGGRRAALARHPQCFRPPRSRPMG